MNGGHAEETVRVRRGDEVRVRNEAEVVGEKWFYDRQLSRSQVLIQLEESYE